VILLTDGLGCANGPRPRRISATEELPALRMFGESPREESRREHFKGLVICDGLFTPGAYKVKPEPSQPVRSKPASRVAREAACVICGERLEVPRAEA
jgi:hypothetical protein